MEGRGLCSQTTTWTASWLSQGMARQHRAYCKLPQPQRPHPQPRTTLGTPGRVNKERVPGTQQAVKKCSVQILLLLITFQGEGGCVPGPGAGVREGDGLGDREERGWPTEDGAGAALRAQLPVASRPSPRPQKARSRGEAPATPRPSAPAARYLHTSSPGWSCSFHSRCPRPRAVP